MKRVIIIIVSVILLIGAIGLGCILSKIHSPEYALADTIADVKAFGADGLKEHLTEDAYEKMDKIIKWSSDNDFVSDFLSSRNYNAGMNLLISQIAEVEWTVEDVLKGKKQAAVVVGFNYREKIVGTIDITMVLTDSQWKINGIGIPDFEKLK